MKEFEWVVKSAAAIQKSGGSVEGVLREFPEDLLRILIVNDLVLDYQKTRD